MSNHSHSPIVEVDGRKYRIKKHTAIRVDDGRGIAYVRLEHLEHLYSWRDIDESRLGEIDSVVINGERLYNQYEFRIVILGKQPRLHLNRLPDHNHRKKVAKRARKEELRQRQADREWAIHEHVNKVAKAMDKYWGYEDEAPAALRKEYERICTLHIITGKDIYRSTESLFY